MTGYGFCGPMTAMGTVFDAKAAAAVVVTGPQARTGESGWSAGLWSDGTPGWAERGWWPALRLGLRGWRYARV